MTTEEFFHRGLRAVALATPILSATWLTHQAHRSVSRCVRYHSQMDGHYNLSDATMTVSYLRLRSNITDTHQQPLPLPPY